MSLRMRACSPNMQRNWLYIPDQHSVSCRDIAHVNASAIVTEIRSTIRTSLSNAGYMLHCLKPKQHKRQRRQCCDTQHSSAGEALEGRCSDRKVKAGHSNATSSGHSVRVLSRGKFISLAQPRGCGLPCCLHCMLALKLGDYGRVLIYARDSTCSSVGRYLWKWVGSRSVPLARG